MNIQTTGFEKNILHILKYMPWVGTNGILAREYLTSETEKPELLLKVQHQSFAQSFLLSVTELLRTGPSGGDRWELLMRFIRMTWAMGKCTSIHFWRLGVAHWSVRREQVRQMLGDDAVLAMEMEALGAGMTHLNASELYAAAKKQPQRLLGIAAENAAYSDTIEATASALVLCCCEEDALYAGLWPVIRRRLVKGIGVGTFGPAQQQCIIDYLERGDPEEILDIQLPTQQPVTTGRTIVVQQYFPGRMIVPAELLGAACFMAMERVPEAVCGLRLCMSQHTQTLQGILNVCPLEYLQRNMASLAAEYPGGGSSLLLQLCFGGYPLSDEERRELMLCCIDDLSEAMDRASGYERATLRKYLPRECAALNRDMAQDLAKAMAKKARAGKRELFEFYLGNGSLADVDAQLRPVEAPSYCSLDMEATGYFRTHPWNDFTCRLVAGSVLGLKCGMSGYQLVQEKDVSTPAKLSMDFYQGFSDAMLERELPLTRLLDILGVFHDNYYGDRADKAQLIEFVTTAYADSKFSTALGVAVKQGSAFTRRMSVQLLNALGDKGMLAACSDTSKLVKELLLDLLPGHPEWMEDYAKLLGSKKAAERLMAVEVLAKLGATDVLAAALDGEKSEKVAEAIRTRLGAEPQPQDSSLAQRVLKGNKIRKLSWLTEQPLPVLHLDDGAEASEDIRNAILLSYSELGRIGRSDSAAQLAEGIRAEDLAALASEVFELWMGENAPAKHKWVLPFAAVFGGSSMTARLTRAINDWPNHARGAIACDAVFALALSSDPAAIVTVDAISRKFKFRQVKAAAGQALENAAQELGITAEELADRIVPTLGFGADGKRTFDYGKRSFTVRLTPTLELAITNQEGKTVKNLPAPGKTDDAMAAAAYEAFKTMKKQIKTTVSAQRSRLEAALSVSRCWNADRWRALFVENPIMHQFAMSLIWGVYEDGVLTDTFRYMEDGSFNTVDEEEFALPETGRIGLVHPVELEEGTLQSWKQQLEDYEITQAIDQLSRPVYTLDPAEGDKRTLDHFGGKVLNGLSLGGKLLGSGWYRGSVVDGGAFYDYYREDAGLGLGVELRFSGTFVGGENEDVTVFEAIFYRAGTVQRGSYVYDKPKEEHIFALRDIPKRYYSEILHQLHRATASSTETRADWREMEE